jgi:mannose/fructose/N-acetylgalactosamine-specific phosphotransferase system component IID
MNKKIIFRQRGSYAVIASLIIGVIFGILLSPLLLQAVGVMSATMSNVDILLVSGVVMALFIPSFLAVRLTERLLMSLVVQFGQGMVFSLLTPYALDAAFSSMLIGVFVTGAVWLVRRNQTLTDSHLMIAAVVIGIVTFILNMIGHGFTLDLTTTAVLLGITLLGAATASWFANQLARLITQTAFGRSIRKEGA